MFFLFFLFFLFSLFFLFFYYSYFSFLGLPVLPVFALFALAKTLQNIIVLGWGITRNSPPFPHFLAVVFVQFFADFLPLFWAKMGCGYS